jgi:hypothetical protein
MREWSQNTMSPTAPSVAPSLAVGKRTQVEHAGVGVELSPAIASDLAIAASPSARLAKLQELLSASHTHFDPLIAFLDTLDTQGLLGVLGDAVDAGFAQMLYGRVQSARPLIRAALYAVELARLPNISPTDPRLQRAGAVLDVIGQANQVALLDYILRYKGVRIEVAQLFEGVLAMHDVREHAAERGSETALAEGAGRGASDPSGALEVDQSVGAAVGSAINDVAGVGPGPWAKPGKDPGRMPPWFHKGNVIHEEIAAYYVGRNLGDDIITNTIPLTSILAKLQRLNPHIDKSVLTDSELLKRPDIINLSKGYLWEIKPEKAEHAAEVRAEFYIGLFKRAGVEIKPGPAGAPGTSGAVPAPLGAARFMSSRDGVIIYNYDEGRLVPVPFRQRQPHTRDQSDKEPGSRDWGWDFEPTKAQREAVVATSLGMGMLLLLAYMISVATA